MLPLSVPHLQGNEWTYVKECLDTEWVSTAGTFVDRFEAQIAAYTGAAYAVACVNGTAALEVALRVVGVLPGDEVLVPTVTFIATPNAVHYLGAHPVFMDCDEYYNLDIPKTLDFLERETEVRGGSTYDRATGRRVAAVVPVHVFGNAARLQDLVERCRAVGVRVVEDAAESLGTMYTTPMLAGRHTGTIGDMGCFSFNGNKIVTTGGGGMIVTDVPAYADKAKYLTTQAKDDEIRYVHNEIGYNYRLTNVQAAIGVAQVEQLPGFLETKRRNYVRYREGIAGIEGLELADTPPYASNNRWMYALQVDAAAYGLDREALMAYLGGAGIQSRPLWRLCHLQTPYEGCRSYRVERAPLLAETTLNIPCSTNLADADVDVVLDRLRRR